MADVKVDFKRVRQVMNTYGEQVVREMVNRLTGFGKIASGELAESLGYTFVEEDGEMRLVWLAAEHWIYVDKGRRPNSTPPPVKPIKEWCRIKGIDEGAAYAIAKSIGRYGIPPTNFFTVSTTRRAAQFEQKRADAFRLDIGDAAALIAEQELKRNRKGK